MRILAIVEHHGKGQKANLMNQNCEHRNFQANVAVFRCTPGEGRTEMKFMAEVTVHCSDCGTDFRFINLPGGCSFQRAMCGLDGTEARLPIEPCPEIRTFEDFIRQN